MIKKVMLIFLLFFNMQISFAKEIDMNNVGQEIKNFNSLYNNIVADYVATSKTLAPIVLTEDTLYKCQKKYKKMSAQAKYDVEKADMLQSAIMGTYKEQVVDKKDFELFQKTANNTKLASRKFKSLYKNSQKYMALNVNEDEKKLLKIIYKQSWAQYIVTKYSYKNLKKIAKYNDITLLEEKSLDENFYLVKSDYEKTFDDINNNVNKEEMVLMLKEVELTNEYIKNNFEQNAKTITIMSLPPYPKLKLAKMEQETLKDESKRNEYLEQLGKEINGCLQFNLDEDQIEDFKKISYNIGLLGIQSKELAEHSKTIIAYNKDTDKNNKISKNDYKQIKNLRNESKLIKMSSKRAYRKLKKAHKDMDWSLYNYKKSDATLFPANHIKNFPEIEDLETDLLINGNKGFFYVDTNEDKKAIMELLLELLADSDKLNELNLSQKYQGEVDLKKKEKDIIEKKSYTDTQALFLKELNTKDIDNKIQNLTEEQKDKYKQYRLMNLKTYGKIIGESVGNTSILAAVSLSNPLVALIAPFEALAYVFDWNGQRTIVQLARKRNADSNKLIKKLLKEIDATIDFDTNLLEESSSNDAKKIKKLNI